MQWTTGQVRTLRQLRQRGLTIQQIAETMGRSVAAIQHAIARFDRTRRFTWTAERLRTFQRLHGEGLSDADIAMELGCNHQVVSRLRRRHAIQSNAYNARHREKLSTKAKIQAAKQRRWEGEALR